ncbi:hypothetical protein PSET11_03035 [Arthrobacter ulcerisalmonis]|uniref:Phage major tail protein 2 n=1 Tax=Arthrobacter ulcerisalmonis TaxID=2483813 RepID=A0A3P5XT66_9MICC|nr:hypothetical protein [Arthrobacter ulcerisalmonis]VDC32269.1 hypothetical protein PSET11_03035 [Arthrobacter ulcerisalmonis]
MPSLPHKVLNVTTETVTIDGVDYSDAITSASLSTTSTDTTWIPVSGNVQTSTGALIWSASLEFGQDLTANTTLTMKLISLHGQNKVVVIQPTGTATQKITFTATIKAPSVLGGGVGVATSSAEFPVSGQPVIVNGV